MENKVYYGEYTLKHWINLMLSGNIVLPEYQRHFVWRERDVKRLSHPENGVTIIVYYYNVTSLYSRGCAKVNYMG